MACRAGYRLPLVDPLFAIPSIGSLGVEQKVLVSFEGVWISHPARVMEYFETESAPMKEWSPRESYGRRSGHRDW